MASTRKKFRFLELPPEIRELIYKEAFTEEIAVHGANHEKVHAPGLLLACKQIYVEAVKTFYRTATFRFWEYDFGIEWYIRLPSMYRDAITKMCYDMQTPDGHTFHDIDTAGLKSLIKILHFWRDVGMHDLRPAHGTLAARAVIWWNNNLPLPHHHQLWNGEPPTTELLPSEQAQHKVVWVSEDVGLLQKALEDSM